MPKKQSESVPRSVEPFYSAIVNLTDAVCEQHLDSEYAEFARRLAAKLARKRPSPIVRGKPEIWACAIIHALGTVNFLFDKTQKPHMKSNELCNFFGVKQTTVASKSKYIRDTLKIRLFDHRWILPSKLDDNPLIWVLQINGLMMDVRDMPPVIQEIAYAKGLIPYVPADRESPCAPEE